MTPTEPRPPTSVALAARLGARHQGDDRPVTCLSAPDAPRPGAVAVWPEPTPTGLAAFAAAGGVAVVATRVAPTDDGDAATLDAHGVALLLVSDPRRALAQLTALFDERPALAAAGIHPSAVVAADAVLGSGVAIAAHAVVGAGAVLGDHVVVGAGASVGAGATVGAGSVLHERVVLKDGVRIGRRCALHAGAVVGADGFGYAFGPRGAEKIHHLGGVTIGDDVEIGANTCIDRGTLRDTRVGDRTKIDNLVQVGHNVEIGSDVVIAALGAVAGSVRIEDRAVLGGGVAIADHVTIGAGARLAGRSGVSKDVPAGATWGGTPAQPMRGWVRERYLIGRLETLWRERVARTRAGDDTDDGGR